MLTGWKRRNNGIYMFETNEEIIYMLCHEMKNSRVRVTYLDGGVEWVWDLEWRSKVLDLTEGANSCAWTAGFEGRKETSLMFLSKLDSKDTGEYLFFIIEGNKCLGFWVLISQVLMNLRILLCFLRIFCRFVRLARRSSSSFA